MLIFKKSFYTVLFLALCPCFSPIIATDLPSKEEATQPASKELLVYVIPLEGEISTAQMYILRRGLKQAVQNKIDVAILKINTPGGDLETTLEMIEALENFKGETLTYVDTEAMSAGAYIAASTDDIFFNPRGILGAAAVIQQGGTEVPGTLKQKIDSYMRAKMRTHVSENRYRSDVIRAMMDTDFVFKIGDKLIKDKGELLTLTAQEAIEKYGDPPQPLLAAGIVDNIDELLKAKYGNQPYLIKNFELTWSEYLARWMNKITPILLGLGMLAIFIELKSPGFGFFGIVGIVLFLIVFASSYIAGLGGHEEVIIFILGLLLLGLEIFVIPGVFVVGALGILMILSSIIWALADVWPGSEFHITPEIFVEPFIELALGLIIACIGIAIIGRYFFHSRISDLLILKTFVGQKNDRSQGDQENEIKEVQMGARGLTVTDLHPGGIVEINSKRYPARVNLEAIDKNTEIEVVGREDFGLIVKNIRK